MKEKVGEGDDEVSVEYRENGKEEEEERTCRWGPCISKLGLSLSMTIALGKRD